MGWGWIGDRIDDIVDRVKEDIENALDLGEAFVDGLDIIYDNAEDAFNYLGEALFGSDTIYSAGTSALRLYQDKPNELNKAILQSSVSNLTSVSTAIVRANMYDSYAQARNFYTYGKNHFVNGTPEGSSQSATINLAALQSVLDNIVGTSVNIQETSLSNPTARFWAYRYMTDHFTWDPTNNLVTGHNVKDSNGVLITEPLYYYSSEWVKNVPDPLRIFYYYEVGGVSKLAFDHYTIDLPVFTNFYYMAVYNAPAADPSEINPSYTPTAIYDAVQVIYADNTTTTPGATPEDPDVVTFDKTQADTDVINWCLARTVYPLQLAYAISEDEFDWINRATELGISGFVGEVITPESKLFIYDTTEGTYPSLALNNSSSYFSPFFPIIPIMQNKEWIRDDPNSALYITGNAALKKMSLSIDEISEAMDSSSSNDSLDDTVDCFATLAMQLTTTSKEGIGYLASFFAELSQSSTYTLSDWNNWIAQSESYKQTHKIPINNFKISEAEFNMLITYAYIEVTLRNGVLGPVDTATRYATVRPDYTFGGVYDSSTERTSPVYSVDNSSITFRRQVTATQYQEVIVHSLKHVTAIANGKAWAVTIGMTETADYKNSFYIPVSLTVVGSLRPQIRSVVCAEAVSVIVYAYKQDRLKWYESSNFITIFQIIIVVIAIITLQVQLTALAAAASWVAATWLIVQWVLYGYLIDLAFEYISDELGAQGALIASIIAAAAAVYTGNIANIGYLPDAATLMLAATKLAQESARISQEKLYDVQEQSEQLYSTYSDKMQEYADIQDGLLNSNDALLEMYKGKVITDFTETPSEFYFRSIHSGNVGTYSLNAVSIYFDLSLQLPDKIVNS